MNDIDAAFVREKVDKAKALVRDRNPQLVGFEAVEIQRFVFASSRPIAIQGASKALNDFDNENNKLPQTIFAGGGRGLMLVAAEDLNERITDLERRFKDHTVGLSLAVASVPFNPKNEPDSLKWLWLKQRSAHDACEPESIELAAFEKHPSCTDCCARPGVRKSPKPDAPATEKICLRCDKLIKRGRASQYASMERWTLEDLSEGGLIGIVSADGNKLGQFFRSLDNLEALRAGSLVVTSIFHAAHEAGLERVAEEFVADPEDQKYIAPITGGDDIKVLLLPTAALEYIDAFMIAVEQRANRADNVGGILDKQAKMLKELGVGVGLLIAPYHVPATRLVDLAQDLEDDSKDHVKKNSNRRSAVCFSVQRVDGESDAGARQTVDAPAWREFISCARRLRQIVPGNQRATAAAAWELDDAERENQLLYQIARSRAWQEWYRTCAVDWRNRKDAIELLSKKGMLALAGLGGRRGRKVS